jgi:hypothetical protein
MSGICIAADEVEASWVGADQLERPAPLRTRLDVRDAEAAPLTREQLELERLVVDRQHAGWGGLGVHRCLSAEGDR